jgi:MoxR-like ATPase
MQDIQRPPAELLYAEELSQLAEHDQAPRPPGWKLSAQAARQFILGDTAKGISPKFVGHPSLVERALVSLATQRALLLVGEPGTAKSLLSELLAAALSGNSRLTLQGSSATSEDQLRYGWNYALLLAQGPTREALIPSPVYQAMQQGCLVRFEELTRCPAEVQDCLLSLLSDKVMSIPELHGSDSALFAKPGFNLIATANTRDRGTHEMSSALKRRFHFETVFPIADPDHELELVQRESQRLLEQCGVPQSPPRDLLEVLVTTFRDLRSAEERLTSAMSTAEAVSVAHALGIRSHYLKQSQSSGEDLLECLLGTVLKDSQDDLRRFRRYLDQVATKRKTSAWQEFSGARHLLP